MCGDKQNVVVFLSYYRYNPGCMQQVVENVFSKELGKYCKLIFLLQGDISNGRRVQRWNNAQVQLTSQSSWGGLVGQVINAVLVLNKFVQLARIMKRERSIIIVVRDQPVLTGVLGCLKFFFKYRLYFQYSAPLGKMKIEYYHVHKSWRRYVYLFSGLLHQLMLGFALKTADLVFPITESFGRVLTDRYGHVRMIPLTMGVDHTWIQRRVRPVSWLENDSRTCFIVGYFGTLSFLRNPQFMLKVFARFQGVVQKSKLLMMGEVAYPQEKRELERLCKELGINDDVIFTGSLDKNTLQDHLKYCNVTLSAIPPESHYVISSPTKVYESLANGVPVIANSGIYEQEKVISESGGGVLVPYDVNSFAAAISSLENKPEERFRMGRRGKDYILTHYSYEKMAENIAPFFKV